MDITSILMAVRPSDIFSDDRDIMKKEYRQYSLLTHPDSKVTVSSKIAFVKLNELYEKAREDLEAGLWEYEDRIRLTASNNKRYEIHFNYRSDFELGTMYVTSSKIVYIFRAEHSKFVENAVANIRHIRYPDGIIEAEISRFMPHIYDTYELKGGDGVIVLLKDRDVYPLRMVQDYYKGSMRQEHIAFIISRLLNMACFFDISDVVHNGIVIENIFINPATHAVYIYGGWWYSVKKNEKMMGISQKAYESIPTAVKNTKRARITTDLNCIKKIIKELSGGVVDGISEPIITWMNDYPVENAILEMNKWDKVIEKAFGKRRFVKMEFNIN